MKFIFTTICNVDGTKTSVEFDAETWPEPIDKLITILRASGYHIPEDAVGINTQYPVAAFNDNLYNIITFNQEQ